MVTNLKKIIKWKFFPRVLKFYLMKCVCVWLPCFVKACIIAKLSPQLQVKLSLKAELVLIYANPDLRKGISHRHTGPHGGLLVIYFFRGKANKYETRRQSSVSNLSLNDVNLCSMYTKSLERCHNHWCKILLSQPNHNLNLTQLQPELG